MIRNQARNRTDGEALSYRFGLRFAGALMGLLLKATTSCNIEAIRMFGSAGRFLAGFFIGQSLAFASGNMQAKTKVAHYRGGGGMYAMSKNIAARVLPCQRPRIAPHSYYAPPSWHPSPHPLWCN
jgi:hypothetical protein